MATNTMTDAENVDVPIAILNEPNRPAEPQQPAKSTLQKHEKSSQVIPKPNYDEKVCKCCPGGFYCIVGKRILRNEQLSDREIELRQRVATLECWIPTVTLIKVLAGEIDSNNIYNFIDEQASKKIVSKSHLHSILSHHDIETERKEAHRRLEEARKLLGEKQSAINERAKQIEEAERRHTSLEQKIGQLEEQLRRNGIDLTKLPSTESITSFGADDLEYITKLEELIVAEKHIQRELEELKRKEKIDRNTLKAAVNLISKDKTNSEIDELRSQLEAKSVANQQLADRICLLEDQVEILKGKLAACNNHLEQLTGTNRLQTMDGASGGRNIKKGKDDKTNKVVKVKINTAAGSDHDTVERKEQGSHAKVRTDTKETHARVEVTDRSVQEEIEDQDQLMKTYDDRNYVYSIRSLSNSNKSVLSEFFSSPDPLRLPSSGRSNREHEHETRNLSLPPVTNISSRPLPPAVTHDEQHTTNRTTNSNVNAPLTSLPTQNNQSGRPRFPDRHQPRIPAGGTQQQQMSTDDSFVSLLSEIPSDNDSYGVGDNPMFTNDGAGAPPARPATTGFGQANNEPPQVPISRQFQRRNDQEFVSLLSDVDENDRTTYFDGYEPQQPEQNRPPAVQQAPLLGTTINVAPTVTQAPPGQAPPRQLAEDPIEINRYELRRWLDFVREIRRIMSRCSKCVWERRELGMLCKAICHHLEISFSVCMEDEEVAPESPEPSVRDRWKNRQEITSIGSPIGMSSRAGSPPRRVDNVTFDIPQESMNTLPHDQAVDGSMDNSTSHTSKKLAEQMENTAESEQMRSATSSLPEDRMNNTSSSNQNRSKQQSHLSTEDPQSNFRSHNSAVHRSLPNEGHSTQQSGTRIRQHDQTFDPIDHRPQRVFNPHTSSPVDPTRSRQSRPSDDSRQTTSTGDSLPSEQVNVSDTSRSSSDWTYYDVNQMIQPTKATIDTRLYNRSNDSDTRRPIPSRAEYSSYRPGTENRARSHTIGSTRRKEPVRFDPSTSLPIDAYKPRQPRPNEESHKKKSAGMSSPYRAPDSSIGLESSDSSQYKELPTNNYTTGTSALYQTTDSTQYGEIQTPNRAVRLSDSLEVSDETQYEELPSHNRTAGSSTRHQTIDSTQYGRLRSPNRTIGSSAFYHTTDSTKYGEIQSPNRAVGLSDSLELSDETLYGELPSLNQNAEFSNRHQTTDSTHYGRMPSPNRTTGSSTMYKTTDSTQYGKIQTPKRAVGLSDSLELSDETQYEELPSHNRTAVSSARHQTIDSTQYGRMPSPNRTTGSSTLYKTTDSTQYGIIQTPKRAVGLSTTHQLSDETQYGELPSLNRNAEFSNSYQTTNSTQHGQTPSANRTTSTAQTFHSDQDGELSMPSQINSPPKHTSTPIQTRRSPEPQQDSSTEESIDFYNETSYFSNESQIHDQAIRGETSVHSNGTRNRNDMSLERIIWRNTAKKKKEQSTDSKNPVLKNIPNVHPGIHQQTTSIQHDSSDNDPQHDSRSESDEKKKIWKREERNGQNRTWGGQERPTTSRAPLIFNGACCTCYTTDEFPKITRSEYERFISSDCNYGPRDCLAASALTRHKKLDTKHQKIKRPHAKDMKTMTKPSIVTQTSIRHRDVNSKLLPEFSCEVCDCEPCSTPPTAHSKSGKTQLNASTNVSTRPTKKNQSASAKIARAKR
ncbi:hypothetical protein PV325_008520 [Microctonus aethiopoides]|nr:hypothetical protein PV325_008520 [Microctonus aethiopoides]